MRCILIQIRKHRQFCYDDSDFTATDDDDGVVYSGKMPGLEKYVLLSVYKKLS